VITLSFAAASIPDRTDVQCLHRWQKVLNPDLIKGPWTEQVQIKLHYRSL
jgi:myb proto-oncogene protein